VESGEFVFGDSSTEGAKHPGDARAPQWRRTPKASQLGEAFWTAAAPRCFLENAEC
jgi:hypothetical protein